MTSVPPSNPHSSPPNSLDPNHMCTVAIPIIIRTWNLNIQKPLGLCRTRHRVQCRYALPIQEKVSLCVRGIAEVDIGSNCFGGKGKVVGWCGGAVRFEVVGGLACEHVPLWEESASSAFGSIARLSGCCHWCPSQAWMVLWVWLVLQEWCSQDTGTRPSAFALIGDSMSGS